MRAVLLALLLAGCAASGPPETALEQRFVWFSYLAGEDMRGCPADGLRLVYNADFNAHVRTLDIIEESGGGARLESRAYEGSAWFRVSSLGLLNAARSAATRLAAADLDRVKQAAAADGVLGPPREGLVLRSHEHYAVIAACAGGRFHLQGYEGARLPRLALFALLRTLDPLDAPWPRLDPRHLPPPSQADTRDQHLPYFIARIGTDGLVVGGPP